ncbi:MAG: hypothetical protein IJH12_00345 [Clostridia bacterium]|nr:hypothetical protein [Clostridia bacterium]
MKFFISIATIIIFIYSTSYSRYEIKSCKNFTGASIVQFFGLFQLIYTNVILYIF